MTRNEEEFEILNICITRILSKLDVENANEQTLAKKTFALADISYEKTSLSAYEAARSSWGPCRSFYLIRKILQCAFLRLLTD